MKLYKATLIGDVPVDFSSDATLAIAEASSSLGSVPILPAAGIASVLYRSESTASQALASGVAVIPVLVDGASMPGEDELPPDLRPLCEVNALIAGSENLGEELDRLARALKDDLTVRTVTARTGGALFYTWTALFGFLAFTIFMSIQSCVPFPAECEPTENPTRPLGLAVVVFVIGFLLIVMIRRALRARRDARRVAMTVMLSLIGPTLLVASICLALTIDPNPG